MDSVKDVVDAGGVDAAVEAFDELVDAVKDACNGADRREFFLYVAGIAEDAKASAETFGWDGI